MAASRQSKAFHRREQQSQEERVRRLTYLGVGGVLALVAVIVVAGLIWGVWLPPREHVLTVGSRSFNAGRVADHAAYLARSGNGAAAADPQVAIDALVRREILLQAGVAEVGEVTDADIRAEISKRLGMADTATDEQYAASLGDYLLATGVSRADLEAGVRVLVMEERLREKFKADLPESGDQLDLLRVATNDRSRAEAVRKAVLDGADLRDAAVTAGIYTDRSQAELGWFAPEALPERVRDAISALRVGSASDVLDDANQVGFEVYAITTRVATEPYQSAVLDQLAGLRFDEFVEAKREELGVTEDLSDSERTWILDQVRRATRN
ncbi:MAG: hypothetical protein Q8M79_05100 [Dehalococcoidia bacterium]|nr:hypothetical protein [Dehalococcoidia bacterium]